MAAEVPTVAAVAVVDAVTVAEAETMTSRVGAVQVSRVHATSVTSQATRLANAALVVPVVRRSQTRRASASSVPRRVSTRTTFHPRASARKGTSTFARRVFAGEGVGRLMRR